jgi:Outer membrane protein beta-barrel domain
MALLLMLMAPLQYTFGQTTSAVNNESSITVYGGDRFGGSVNNSTTNSSVDLQNGSSFGAAVDIGLDRNTQVELFYSQQNTALSSGGFSSQANNFELTLYNYQIGGTAFIQQVGRGPFVMGGVGGTTAKPKLAGLNSQTFFSGNLGVGWMIPIGAHVGLKFEARGYGILLNNNSSLFCGGASTGCIVSIKGSGLFYGEVLAGIAARF